MGALAVLIAVVQAIGVTLTAHGGLDLRAYALLAVSSLAVAPSRRTPSVAFLVCAAATVAYWLLDYGGTPTFLGLIVTLLVAAAKDRWPAVFGATAFGFIVWYAITEPAPARAIGIGVACVGAVIGSGIVVGIGREIRKLIREQRRLHEERSRRQKSEERLRIAQELHDVLGHHLSLINMRARVGLHLMDRQPEQARAALNTINAASSEALREVRSVLDTLYPAGEAPPKAPAPGLAQLDTLTHDAGLPVTTTVDGEIRELPAEIDRAAYRIVQEALTNVRRHAAANATATVTLGYRADRVTIEIADDGGIATPTSTPADWGSPAEPVGEGNGISGMRERAALLDGTLTAGPRPGGGWTVRAEFPVPPESPEPAGSPTGSPAGSSAGCSAEGVTQ